MVTHCDFDEMVEADASDPFAAIAAASAAHAVAMREKAEALARMMRRSAGPGDSSDPEEDDVEDRLWEAAYAPATFDAFVGNSKAKDEVTAWLAAHKARRAAIARGGKAKSTNADRPALLLAGPSGIGKTSLARLALRQAGYAIWTGRMCAETGTRKDEARGTLAEELDSILSRPAGGGILADAETPRPFAVLLETVEGMAPAARKAVVALLRSFTSGKRGAKASNSSDDDDDEASCSGEEAAVRAGRTTTVPILITADTTHESAVKPFVAACHVVRMYRSDTELVRSWGGMQAPTDDAIRRVLTQIAVAEGVTVPSAAMLRIVGVARGSVRAAVNTLQYLLRTPPPPLTAPSKPPTAATMAKTGGPDITTELAAKDESMDLFAAVDRLCYGAPPTIDGATAALSGFDVDDAMGVTEMTALNVAKAVDARVPVGGGAKKERAVAAAAEVASATDVYLQRVAASKDFQLADAGITLGTWGTATALRSSDTKPLPAFAPAFGRIDMNLLWGFRTKAKARWRRLRLLGVVTTPGLSADTRALAARPFMAPADAADADRVHTVDVGVGSVGSGGGTKRGRETQAKAAVKAAADAVAAKLGARRRADKKEEEVVVRTAAGLTEGAHLWCVAPPPFDVLERAVVLRQQALALLASSGLNPEQHAKRKALLEAHALYSDEHEVQALLQRWPFPEDEPPVSVASVVSVGPGAESAAKGAGSAEPTAAPSGSSSSSTTTGMAGLFTHSDVDIGPELDALAAQVTATRGLGLG